jgi:ligand-binding sensor domain-containing protein
MRLLNYLLITILSLFFYISHGQSPKWLNYTNGDVINDIYEEGNYLWVGTNGGIVKVDKTTGTPTFFNQSSMGALLNGILSIAVDKNNVMWLGTENIGIVKYDGSQVSVYDSTSSNIKDIVDIEIDAQNKKWFIASGYLYDLTGTTITFHQVGNSTTATSITIDPLNNMWVGTKNEGLWKYDGVNWTNIQYPNIASNNVTDIEFDHNGDIWVATGTDLSSYIYGGINKYSSGNWSLITTGQYSSCRHISKDKLGMVWIAGNNDYVNLETSVKYSVYVPNTFACFYVDQQNNLWTGTWSGLYKLNQGVLTNYSLSNACIPYRSNTVYGVGFDSNNKPWIALYNEYLQGASITTIQNAKWENLTHANSRLSASKIKSILIDKNDIKYFVNEESYSMPRILQKNDGNYWTDLYVEKLEDEYMGAHCGALDHNNNFWAGFSTRHFPALQSTISKYDGADWTFIPKNGDGTSGKISSIAIDKNNNVWVTTGGYLGMYNGSTWTFYGPGGFDNFTALTIDKQDNKWFIDDSEGIQKFNAGTFTQYTKQNSSLPGNFVRAIKADSLGNIWLGIDEVGLVKFDGINSLIYTTENSGISGELINSVEVDKNNTKWISTSNGIVLFNESGIPAGSILEPCSLPSISAPSTKAGDTITGCMFYEISWQNNTGQNITATVYYSLDGGLTWKPIEKDVLSLPGNNKTTWKILGDINSTNCLIKIVNQNLPSMYSVSNGLFTVKSPANQKLLTITSPVKGSTLKTGEDIIISWTGTASRINIEYSSDNGATWNTIISNILNTGSYKWTTPGVASSEYVLRVNDYFDNCVTGSTDFQVIATPFFTITYPNAGQTLYVGSSQTLTWVSGNINSGLVNIDVSLDSGATWNSIAIAEANDGSYSWTVPNSLSAKVLFKISDNSDALVYDINNVCSKIEVKPITVVNPAKGEIITTCKKYDLKWTSKLPSASYRSYYSSDNGLTWTSAGSLYSTASPKTYSWSPPEVNCNPCLLKITDLSNKTIYGISDTFSIVMPPNSLKITYPKGGENILASSYTQIKWSGAPVDYYTVSYSLDSGATWLNISSNVYGLSSYWTVPSVNSSKALVKVVNNFHPTCYFGQSDSVFSISIVTSADDLLNASGIIVSPNPNYGSFLVKSESEAITIEKIELHDVTGKMIFESATASNNINVNVSGISEGIYFLKVVTPIGIKMKQIIIN